MTLAEFQVGQVVWSLFWLSLFVLFVSLVILVFGDIIRSNDISGWAKAGWALAILLLPFVGIIVYLAVRGGTMSERRRSSPPSAYESVSQSISVNPVRY